MSEHVPPEQLLSMLLAVHLKQLGTTTFEGALAQIEADATNQKPEQYDYTRRTAHLLQGLKENGNIQDWLYVPRDSVLDALKDDFIVIRNDSGVIPLQITSDPRKGRARRKGIREMFGLTETKKPVIPVLQLNRTSRIPLSDPEARQRIMDLVSSTIPLLRLNEPEDW